MNIKHYIRPLMLGLFFVILALGGGSLVAQEPTQEAVIIELSEQSEVSKTTDNSSIVVTPSKGALTLKEQDPSGLVLTLTAVIVVFSALALLFLVFKGVGRIFQAIEKPKGAVPSPITTSHLQQHSKRNRAGDNLSPEALVGVSMALHNFRQERESEIMAAISMALHCELEQSHDNESFVLTISRKSTQWNARALGMRQQY